MKRVCEMLLTESMQYYTVDVYLEYSDPIILEEDPVQQSIAKAFVCEVFFTLQIPEPDKERILAYRKREDIKVS